jgi:DNA-binding transcriptional ArsR family regulator
MGEYPRHARLNRIFSALGDPTRRLILRALAQHPATITEIARPFRFSLNAISKHVMVLEEAGLVHREIRGREHHCRIDARPLREANDWLEHYRQFWELRLDALELYVARKYKDAKKGRARGKLR